MKIENDVNYLIGINILYHRKKLTHKLINHNKKTYFNSTNRFFFFLSSKCSFSLSTATPPPALLRQVSDMALSFLSPISLYAHYLRRCFTSSGLSRQSVEIDGDTTLHFWGPNSGERTTVGKPSLVLIHGFGPVALWQWRKQVQFFSAHFNIYVPDLIFFGESTTKSSERSEIFQAESVSKLLEKLRIEKYSLMGTSYGGLVAYHVARMWPERVDKVVIASSGVNMRKSDNEKLVAKSKLESIGDLMLPKKAFQLRSLLGLAVYGGSVHMVPDFFLNDFIHKLYAENRNEKLQLLKALSLGKSETINLSPLQQDALLIWGEHDQIFPLEMAYELQGVIGKEVKLEIIKDASHVPQIEKPLQFNSIVYNFLCGSS